MGSSLKLAVVSATVFSSAVMLKLLTPLIMDLTISDLPSIYTSLISWLKPPYLYVVINCIIITIVASSKLQSSTKLHHDSPISISTPHDPIKLVLPVDLPPVIIHEPVNPGLLLQTEPVMFVQVPAEPDFVADAPQFTDDDIQVATQAYEEITKNKINKNVISWTPSKINQVDLSFPVDKPPASARFTRRKPSKATAEGGKTLGVAKPKKQDTLETTWKTITEGRSVPLTRHLRKSDTWETPHGHVTRNSEDNSSFDNDHHPERMTKSDTFDVNCGGGSARKPPPAPQPSKLSRSGGSGRLKKDPSLGQEELNRRVEAFIKKFNEDMRLQRQESLNQYMEMINRGAH